MTTQEQPKKRGRKPGSGPAILQQMQDVIEYVGSYTKKNNMPPTLNEIAEGIGRKPNDKPAVSNMVKVLIAEGFLENVGRFRSLRVTAKGKRKRFYP